MTFWPICSMIAVMDSPPFESLSKRQRECLLASVAGMESAEIAHLLGISTNTVDDHFRSMNQKLGMNRRLAGRLLRSSSLYPQWLRDHVLGIELPAPMPQRDVTERPASGVRDAAFEGRFSTWLEGRPDIVEQDTRHAVISPLSRLTMVALLVVLIAVAILLAPNLADGFQAYARAIRDLIT